MSSRDRDDIAELLRKDPDSPWARIGREVDRHHTTIAAVRSGRLPGDTGRGRLVVTWDDPINYGGEAYGLLDALTGAGIAAGLRPVFSGVVPDRMLVPEGAERGVIHIAVGDDAITAWRNEPGAVEIAHADGRSADAIEERDRLLGEARRQLRRDGEDPRLIDNGMQAAIGVDLGPDVVRRLNRLRQIGLPVAVFWAPPGT